jgi:hypothetical protein
VITVLDVPDGWSNPPSVNLVHAILLLGGVPLTLFVLIALAVYLPSLVRGERITPGQPPMENQWLGGPRTAAGELTAPQSADRPDDSDAGGASGRW